MLISDWSSDVCSSDLSHCCSQILAALPPEPQAWPRAFPAPLLVQRQRAAPSEHHYRRTIVGGDRKSIEAGDLEVASPVCAAVAGVEGKPLPRSAITLARVRPAADREKVPGIVRESAPPLRGPGPNPRSEEHTSELQSLMRISYAVFCLKTKKK